MSWKKKLKNAGHGLRKGMASGMKGVQKGVAILQEVREEQIKREGKTLDRKAASLKRENRKLSLMEQEESLKKRRNKLSGNSGGFGF